MALELLDANTMNRPIRQVHVRRITREIKEGRWQFNGDTIKIADTNAVLDGQHRLWAVIEAKVPIETVIVRGVPVGAFTTIDTIRASRSFGDVIAGGGQIRHRNAIGGALAWLLRWQSKEGLESYKSPSSRLENSDISQAFDNNPGIVRAVEVAQRLRSLCNPSITAFVYYVLSNRNEELAERMIATLDDPAGIGIGDPYFRLRSYLTGGGGKTKDPLVTIALFFKASNSAYAGEKIKLLSWRNQGKTPEAFPVLKV